jgi:hypothetical protein
VRDALALIVFVVVAGPIIGGYYAVTMLPGVRPRSTASPRTCRPIRSRHPKSGDDSVLQHKLEGPLPGMDRQSPGPASASAWRLIEQSGVRTTPSAIGLMCLLCAAICGVITFMFVPQRFAPLAAVCFGAFAVRLPQPAVGAVEEIEEQFRSADLLARHPRRHALQTALGMAAENRRSRWVLSLAKTFEQQNFDLRRATRCSRCRCASGRSTCASSSRPS